MATSNYTPDHVSRSFDRLTDIVCTATPEVLAATLDRLEERNKINRKERRYIEVACLLTHYGVDDAGFQRHAELIAAAMVNAETVREWQFLHWMDGMLEGAYVVH